MIVDLLQPDNGKILVDNIDVEEESLKAKSIISYVPDNSEIITLYRISLKAIPMVWGKN